MMIMKSSLLSLPIILSASFNSASAESANELTYQDILDSYASTSEAVATARFYQDKDNYEIVPVFK